MFLFILTLNCCYFPVSTHPIDVYRGSTFFSVGYKRNFCKNVDYYPTILQSNTPLPINLLPHSPKLYRTSSLSLLEGRISTSSEGSEQNIFCFFPSTMMNVAPLTASPLLVSSSSSSFAFSSSFSSYSFTFILLPLNYRPQTVQLRSQPPFSHRVFTQTHSAYSHQSSK